MPTTIDELVQLSKNLEIFTLEWLTGGHTGPLEEGFFVMDDYQPRKKSSKTKNPPFGGILIWWNIWHFLIISIKLFENRINISGNLFT